MIFVGATQREKNSFEFYRDPLRVNKAKATAGITAQFLQRAHIEEEGCDLDVGLRFPFGAGVKKVGLFVL